MPLLISFLSFTFAIVQQPNNDYGYISTQPQTFTQYMRPVGSISLLVHERFSGEAFVDLKQGGYIWLIYADHQQAYAVTEIDRYHAVNPADPYTDFLNEAGYWTQEQLYETIYNSMDGRLILQACFDGTSGRLFVIAYPVTRAAERIGK